MIMAGIRPRLIALCALLIAVLFGSLLALRVFLLDVQSLAIGHDAHMHFQRTVIEVDSALHTYRERATVAAAAQLAGADAPELVAEAQAEFQRLLEALQALQTLAPQAERDRSVRLQEAVLAGTENTTRLVEALAAGDREQAARYTARMRDGMAAADALLDPIKEQAFAQPQGVQRRQLQLLDEALRLTSWMFALAVVLAGGIALFVQRRVLRPLSASVAAARRLAAGYRALAPPAAAGTEFEALAESLSELGLQAQRLDELAHSDPLTTLGNRARLEESLQQALEAARTNGRALALMIVDLDHFKAVNDTLGHQVGDDYLREAAERIRGAAGAAAVCCRYSGDEFTVMLPDLDAGSGLQEQVVEAAERLRRELARPVILHGQELSMTASLGVALYPDNAMRADEMISQADAAMALAKQEGRNQIRFTSRALTERLRTRLALSAEIRRGVDAGEFEPFFQPIVDVADRQVVGFEALLRWHHPQRGLIGPSEFIDVAEESGVIGALGEWCLLRSCQAAARWHAAGQPAYVAVNLSPRQLHDPGVVAEVARVLERSGIDPASLQFELTESAMMLNPERAALLLREFKAMGIGLSMDDFGTGYSSLSYLQRFPVDQIKIDRSFVARMGESREAEAIIVAALAIAKGLDLRVVAEGVEREDQRQALASLGCTLQQGYLYAPALPGAELEPWMQGFTAERLPRVATSRG